MKKNITQQPIKSKMVKFISYAGLFSCVAFFCFSNSLAETPKNLESHEQDLHQIENYLNNIKDLSSNFVQEFDGKLVEGKFYLSRPGKMRIEYKTQPKIMIIVNGSTLAYQDLELDETSYLSTNTTPASFLTRQNISFSAKDVEVTDIKKSDKQIRVSVMKKNRKDAGEFSLTFSTNPLKFIKMEVKSDLNQLITVTLTDTDFTSPISNQLFVVKNKILP